MSIEQIVAKSTAASGSLPETVSFEPTHMPERLDKPETDPNETRGGIVASWALSGRPGITRLIMHARLARRSNYELLGLLRSSRSDRALCSFR